MVSKENMTTEELEKALESNNAPKLARFALAAMGSIPFAGGVFSGIGGAWSEAEQEKINSVFRTWLKLQEEELEQIGKTLSEVLFRLDLHDEQIVKRIESKEFSSIVKKCFRDWSAGDSEDKRIKLRNLLANAASCNLTSDDVIKLFIEWIAKYSVVHFKVISIVYKNEMFTRYQIWSNMYGGKVREDSAEADLFKLVIQDLSMGHVIRQYRAVDSQGFFLKEQTVRKKTTSKRMKSAFDDEKKYVLTSLGKQFVHYTMNEIVPRISYDTSI